VNLRPYQQTIISQVKQAYSAGYMHPCIVAPCGSGKTVIAAELSRRTTLNKNKVLFIVHRQELCEQTISTFAAHGVDMKRCQVGMVQTVTRRLDKTEPPALIITDENHHCLAASYRRIYQSWPTVHTVGITATPIRLSGGGLGEINDILIQGVTAKYLISAGYLAPYDYYAPAVIDTAKLHSKGGDYDPQEAFSSMDKPAIYGDVVRHYQELSQGQKAICYCASIAHSQRMAQEFTQAGIAAAHIDGSTAQADRAAAIEGFRNGTVRVLCNVDLISEGFDVPDCGVSILLRPTKSLTLYIQQAMRCMRYLPGKKAIVIDHVANYTRFGLPDQDREWQLDPKQAEVRNENKVKVRQCPQCYYTHETAPVCPHCGYVYPVEDRTLKEIKEARLQKIEGFVTNYITPAECKSYDELKVYAKIKGYKPGWVFHMAKVRGYI
jgi:superfamily II DNA or RNA helicase